MTRRAARLVAGLALPVLRRLDPETAHDLGLIGLRWLQPWWPSPATQPHAGVTCLGMSFRHPVGLAAGFDKNGDFLEALGALGFSHIELGTVTPRPQSGNEKPRMFRVCAEQALINRMGFNNKGVDHLVAQVAGSSYRGVRGVSIGKNFDTPLKSAHHDYVTCLRKVYAIADYVAVNVSSPNTARLRELQGSAELQRVLGSLLEERLILERSHGRRVPLLVKVAPDLNAEQIAALANDLRALQVDGVIATNTSIDFSLLRSTSSGEQRGGVSGAPLHASSLRVITQLRAELGNGFPIIGVGGIVSAENALTTLRAGANLLQIYTGFAYRGDALLREILDALS